MPEAHVLVVNCGSSSIKLALLQPGTGSMPWKALGERLGTAQARLTLTPAGAPQRSLELPHADHDRALDVAFAELPPLPLGAVGHRVVHGGEAFAQSVLLDARVIEAIEACSELAPLHNPANLSGIHAALRKRPDLGQVAVFDTAFHQTMPAHAYLYAIPYGLYEKNKIRRYGFHGTSHLYVAEKAAELLSRPLCELSLITAHLGNGASAAAIHAGRSVDTSMGLTPLEGLVMGTRSGDVDPNLHSFLVDTLGMTLDGVTDMLNKQSGLLGVSGQSNDMRTLLELEASGHAHAKLAIDLFCYRLAKAILGLSAALPTVDALVFTGGIGENSAAVRERTARWLAVCGVVIDAQHNEANGRASNGVISTSSSRVKVLCVRTNEELVIAREALRVVQAAAR
ncbi:MAG TPA: acetate kinase [Polyangiales bacterium]|nr:acetate kinase [Polyangiales bacterium]